MKKFLIAFLTALLGILCAIGLVACGNKNEINGTYYPYENGSYDKTAWIKLDGDKWSTNDGDSGTFEVKGDEIVIYIDLYGSKQIFSTGSVKDGVLTMTTAGITKTFCKDGAKPSNSPNTPPSTEKVTITYHANGGKFANESETFSQTVNKNALLTAPDSPVRTNYTFAGWATSKNGSSMWKFDEDRAADGITLWAKWTEKSAVILSVDGASINGNNIFMLVNQNTDAVSLSNKVVCSSDSVWRLYYDRLGQTEIPTKMAAGLSGYLANGNNVFYMVVTSQDGVQTNLYELTVHRSYAVSVNYYNGVQLLKSESVYTGNTFTANYTPQIDGYTFNGWKDSEGNALNEFAVWAGKSLFADKTANQYNVTFNVNGGNDLSAAEQTVTYDNEYRFAVPTKTGHSFLGWYYGSTQVTDGTGKIAAWQIADDVTLTAKWEANTYTLTVASNNTNAGTVTGGGDYKYGSNVTLAASTKDGYTFTGWFNGNEEVSRKLTYTLKMGFTASYTAKWIRCPVSIYSDNTSIGTVTDLPAKTIAGVQYTVKATVNLGYIAGWYQGSTKLNSDYSFTFTMPSSGSVTYTAKYQIDPAMSNFTFTSMLTTCTITGVKNKNVTEIMVPDYVTNIQRDAFLGCGGLTNVTIPFVGASKNETNNTYFGYIFGASGNSDNLKYVPNSLKSVIITGGTSIGYSAFSGCSGLTSITIPDSVTSIGDYAFSGCSGLTSITIPDNLTSIGRGVFSGCRGLENITVTAGNRKYHSNGNCLIATANKTLILGCKNSVIPTDGSVTSIGNGAFNGCSGLTRITIPNSVTNIGDSAFEDCNGLTSIAIPDGVTSIGDSAFEDCSGLTRITISNSVTSIGDYAFSRCSKLTSITIPDGVTSIGSGTFSVCYGLASITIPNGVTSIGFYAFGACVKLISITIPNSVTSIEDKAFNQCYRLIEVLNKSTLQINAGSSTYGMVAYYAKNVYTQGSGSKLTTDNKGFIIYDGNTLVDYVGNQTEIVIPNAITNINHAAFMFRSELTSITIPEGVTSIGDYSFNGCSELTSIALPNSVTSIGKNAFCGCSKPTSITIPNSVTSIGSGAFNGCSGLTRITIPNSVTSIGDNAFMSCSRLTSITIPNSVTSIGYAPFAECNLLTIYCEATQKPSGWNSNWNYSIRPVVWDCINNELASDGCIYIEIDNLSYSLKGEIATVTGILTEMNREISIPQMITYKGHSYSVISIGDYSFYGCSALTSITIPDSVTSIGRGVFIGCSGLTSIVIPDGVTSIGNYAFEDCSGLKSITIPDSVTSIGNGAFSGCSGLKSITIPDSVTSIGNGAFSGCSGLTGVTFADTSDWKVSQNSNMSNYISLSSSDLSTPAIAVSYLKSNYCRWYWKRG